MGQRLLLPVSSSQQRAPPDTTEQWLIVKVNARKVQVGQWSPSSTAHGTSSTWSRHPKPENSPNRLDNDANTYKTANRRPTIHPRLLRHDPVHLAYAPESLHHKLGGGSGLL